MAKRKTIGHSFKKISENRHVYFLGQDLCVRVCVCDCVSVCVVSVDGMYAIKYRHVRYIIYEHLHVYISINQVSKHKLHSCFFLHVFISPYTSLSLHVLSKQCAVSWTFPEWSLGLWSFSKLGGDETSREEAQPLASGLNGNRLLQILQEGL